MLRDGPRAALLTLARWIPVVAAMGYVGGLRVMAAGAALMAWHLVAAPAPRLLLSIAVGTFALVPVVWLVRATDRLETPAAHIQQNALANELGCLALAVLVIAVFRDITRPEEVQT